MLSIGKVGMSRSQQLYYEEQVAKGREDYYAGKGEAPGRWVGEGARALGLSGELDARAAEAADGWPASGEWRAAGGPWSAGVDGGVGSDVLGAEERERAVRGRRRAALTGARGGARGGGRRRCVVHGAGGVPGAAGAQWHEGGAGGGAGDGVQRARSQRAGGFVAAAYRHRMSRAQDPQLHTHVVCANMAQGPDGRWTALDGDRRV